jgi:nucleoside 2-deoxyribosyltransferase
VRPRVYLAGPEVFLPDAKAVGAEKVRLAAAAGFVGCFPLDNALDLDGLEKGAQARRILLANEVLMRSCDLIIANCTPFRGVAMDSGTAYEVGFMRALGKPVFGYTANVDDYAARARAFRSRGIPAGDCDRPDCEIEDFDLAENLMIASAAEDCGSPLVRAGDGAARMDDLTGYRLCLMAAARHFGLITAGSDRA